MLADEVKRDGGDTEVFGQTCEKRTHNNNMYNNFIVSLLIFSSQSIKDSDVSAADPGDNILKKVGHYQLEIQTQSSAL